MILVLGFFVGYGGATRCACKTLDLYTHDMLRKNFLHVPRTIKFLWNLPLDRFNCACVELFTWYYLCAYKLLSLSLYRAFAQRCRMLHAFFSHIYVDIEMNTLVYLSQNNFVGNVDGITHLQVYWLATVQTAYQKFYAVYFDCIARLFLAAICDVYVYRYNNKRYNNYLVCVKHFNNELHMIFEVLIGSVYERRCAQQLVRYQELISLITVPCLMK